MDEAGRDKYYVKGEMFSWGKKLHIYNLAGNEVAFIQQKIFSFLPKYYVYMNGSQVAEIVKEFTFLRPRYSISGLGWKIDGEFWAHDYSITQGDRQIVIIQKQWFTWGDCYTVDIENQSDEILGMAVVLTIDCVMAAASSASSN